MVDEPETGMTPAPANITPAPTESAKGGLTRRQFVGRAAAAGVAAAGASAISAPVFIRNAFAATPVSFWTSHTDPDLEGIKKIVSDFNAANPDIEVKLTQVVGSETDVTKLMTAVRGGTGPDVYMLDRFTVAQRASDGVLEDLSKYVPADYGSNYITFAWNEAQYNGKPYALPFDTDARAIYYNPKMLQAAGVDPAQLDPKEGAITFDDLHTIAFKVNKTDSAGNYTQMGFVPYYDQGWHYTYGFAMGGTFFDAAKCQVTPTEAGVMQAFQWMYDWAKASNPSKEYAVVQAAMASGYPPQQHKFLTQTVALNLTGDWFIASLKEYTPNLEYGITYIPVLKKGDTSVTWSGGWSHVIPVGAKQPEAGFKFMQYACGADGLKTYTTMTSHMPTWKALLADDSLYAGNHLFFKNLLPNSKSRPVLPVGALYWDQLTSAWQKVYLNQGQPADVLNAVAGQVNPQLQQFCPLKSS